MLDDAFIIIIYEQAFYLSSCKISELGVLSWRLDADNYETDEELKKIREARGYSYMVCLDDINEAKIQVIDSCV